jgi:hypothetical protein
MCMHGDDMPDVTGWRWGREEPAAAKVGTTTEVDNV